MSRLGGPEGRLAADRLAALHRRLVTEGATGAARRLAEMDASVRSLPFSVSERLIAPDQIVAELDDVHQKQAQRLGHRRNVFALAPLLVTWVALATSTFFYHREVTQHPELVTQPFMLLWEQRFGGAPVLRFYEIAVLDAALILLIMVLTGLLHRAEKAGVRKQEATTQLVAEAMLLLAVAVEKHNRTMPMSSQDWAREAQRVITAAARGVIDLEAALKASELRSQKFLNELAAASKGMVDAARAANERFVKETVEQTSTVLRTALAADRKLVNDEMAPLVAGLRTSVNDFTANAAAHRADAATFATVVTDLGDAAKSMALTSTSSSAAMEGIGATLTKIESSQREFATKVGGFVAKVSESTENVTRAANAIEDVGGTLRTDLGSIASDLRRTGGALNRVTSGLSGAAHSVETASAELRAATAGLGAQVADAVGAVGGAPSRRRRLFGR